MKKLSALFALLLLTCTVYAQSFCGTEMPPDFRQQFSAQQAARVSCPTPQTILYTPVQIHIVGDNNGNGYFERSSAYELICVLNEQYAPLNMAFFMSGPIQYIDSTPYYHQINLAYGNQMIGLYNEPDVCNIYIVDYLAGICGLAFFPNSGPDQGRGGIILKKSCAQPGNATLAHEMGHYFSLPHTFQDWNNANAEFVDGSNCATKGDLFCDTPADFLDNRWNCPYTGTQLDPQGQPYAPDGSLFMSYSNEPCPYRFSPMQQAAVIYSRINDRPYLDNTPVPSFSTTPVTLVAPVNNAVNVHSNNNALFSWNAVAGALDYLLLIKKINTDSFSNAEFSVFTTDTFASINGLLPDTTYEWEVIPVTAGFVCIYQDSALHQVNTFTVIFVDDIPDAAAGAGDLLIYPVPFYEQELRFRLESQGAGTAEISIADASGRIVYTENRAVHQGINNGTVQLPQLPAGLYFVSFRSPFLSATQRIIKLDK